MIPKLPSPTGNPWVPSPADPATVPVPLPIIIVGVNGPYTERDRKLWMFLLHAFWDSCFTNSGSYFMLQVLCLHTLGIFPIVSRGNPFEGKCRKMLCVALQVIG